MAPLLAAVSFIASVTILLHNSQILEDILYEQTCTRNRPRLLRNGLLAHLGGPSTARNGQAEGARSSTARLHDILHWVGNVDRCGAADCGYGLLPLGVDKERGEPQLLGGVSRHSDGGSIVRDPPEHRGHLPAPG
jgi:hypothetical protein